MKRNEQIKANFKRKFFIFWTPFWKAFKESPKLYFQPVFFVLNFFKKKEDKQKKLNR